MAETLCGETFRIRFNGGVPTGAGMPKRVFHAIRRKAWSLTAEFWYQHCLEKHFTNAGAREYGYAPRSGEGKSGKAFWTSYTGKKQKKLHHTRPLEYSGESKRLAQQRRWKAYSAGKRSGVKIFINAPALNFKPKGSKVNMRQEITAVSPQDAKMIVDYHNRVMCQLLNEYHGFYTITIN